MYTTLGLDISPLAVTAVLVSKQLQRRRIEACYSIPHSGGQSIDLAIGEIANILGRGDCPCVTAVSTRLISFHTMHLPFKSEKKIRQIMPFELEPRLLTSLDDTHFDLCCSHMGANHTSVLAGTIARCDFEAFLARLRGQWEPVCIDIRSHALARRLLSCRSGEETFAVLDLDDEVLTLCHKGEVEVHRGLCPMMYAAEDAGVGRGQALIRAVINTIHAHGASTQRELRPTTMVLTGAGADDQSLLALFAAQCGCEVVPLDLAAAMGIGCSPESAGNWQPQTMNTALALAVRGKNDPLGFNFLRGEYLPAKAGLPYAREVRKGMAWAAVLIALLSLENGLEYQRLSREYQALDQQARQIFHRVFPQDKIMVDPLMQMRSKIKGLKKGGGSGEETSRVTVLELLQEISVRTLPEWKVQITGLVVDADTIQMKGVTDNFNTVDALKQELAKSTKVTEVTISAATLDRQKNVAFDLRMRKAL